MLEGALCGVPQVAFYKLTDALYRIAQRRVPHIVRGPVTLPNLIAGHRVVPELLQYDFTPERLLEESRTLPTTPARRRKRAGIGKSARCWDRPMRSIASPHTPSV